MGAVRRAVLGALTVLLVGAQPAAPLTTAAAGEPKTPTSWFTVPTIAGPAPFEVAFTDDSTGSPTSWRWTFGDGGASTRQNPTHTYHLPGYYTVTLIASNGAGAGSAVTQVLAVSDPLPGPNRPTASFTVSPETGRAPFTVSFADTSTNSPTSWEWSFADGSTSTEQNPTHTFATAAYYPVRLVASNADGASDPVTRWVIVTEPPASEGGTAPIVVQTSSEAVSATATTAVRVPRPPGLVAGNVLIASITTDGTPSMAAVPAGWEPVIDPLSMGTAARLFGYYRVVTDVAAEPTSYTWTLARAGRWSAVTTAFSGVDGEAPFDTRAATAVVDRRTSSLAVPGVTTVTPGAMLVGGIGSPSETANTNAPEGWGVSVGVAGGQVTALAFQGRPTTGGTGPARWSIDPAERAAGWQRALRPAAGG